LETSSNKALSETLEEISLITEGEQGKQREEREEVVKLIKSLATVAMSEAEYFATDSASASSSYFHYGLAAEKYTHFT